MGVGTISFLSLKTKNKLNIIIYRTSNYNNRSIDFRIHTFCKSVNNFIGIHGYFPVDMRECTHSQVLSRR